MSARALMTPDLAAPVTLTGPDEVALPGGAGAVVATLRVDAAGDRAVVIRGHADPSPLFARPIIGGDPITVTDNRTVTLRLTPTGWEPG